MKVLIVDDEPYLLELFEDVIKDNFDCEIEFAADGFTASSKAKNTQFDVILTDFRMPLVKGDEFIEEIKGGEGPNRNTPIIIISAHSKEALSVAQKFNLPLVEKPYNEDKVVELIKQILGENQAA